jgi:hypothetical protein
MKKIIIFMMLLICAVSLNAQNKDSLSSSNPNLDYRYQIDHIRYCAGQYNKQIMTGYKVAYSGVGVILASSLIASNVKNHSDDVMIVGSIFGGILVLAGTREIIRSNKWMKKIYVGPNGIGIKYNF